MTARQDAVEAPKDTDVGNAARLVEDHGEQIRYVHLWRSWLTWDGRRWRRDESGDMVRRAKATVQAMYNEALEHSSPDRRAQLVKHAVRSEGEPRIRAMINLAAAERSVAPEQLDADPWLFNAANGTVDLRTGELRPHGEEDLITKISPAAYRPGAPCDRWLAFLDRIFAGDAELIEFVRLAAGYSLTGSTREQVLFLLHGAGQNGKTTLLEVLRHIAGDYASQVPADSLMATRQSGIPNDLARLPGARFVSAVETDEGRRLAEGLVKRVTGGDTITARFLHAEFFDFRPQFALWLAANHLPTIRGTDDAIWRRIRLVPFTVQIPAAERDNDLQDKLVADEADGILTWAIAGATTWATRGLTTPSAVLHASSTYRADQDTLGDFLADRCVLDPAAWVSCAALYREYTAWAEANGEKPIGQRSIYAHLEPRGITRGQKTRIGKVYLGLGILDSDPTDTGQTDPTLDLGPQP